MASRKKDSSYMGIGESTPLATKLQQAWLQSQLPKVAKDRNPSSSSSIFSGTETSKAPIQTNPGPAASTTSKPVFSSPTPKGLVPPTLRSYSIKESDICNHQGSSSPLSDGSSTSTTQGRVGEFAESESLTTFLDDMLMEEDIDNTWFVDQESNAYQAMEKSFADLIDEVPVLPPLDAESNMFKDKEKGVVATTDEYNNKSSSNDSLDFTRLSEEIFEERALTEVTDMLSQRLGQMCLSLESTTSNNEFYMTNTPRVSTISNNRPHETTTTMSAAAGAASMHHLGRSTGGGLQHDLKFEFETGPEDELVDLLIRCAEAIGQNDLRTASQLIMELRECSSPHGSGAQRMAHYVTDALVAKMSGIGAQLYATLGNAGPSFGPMLRAYKLMMDRFPFKQISHFISSVLTLNAFKGATRVHLVAYGAFGIHWPFLMQQLAMQPNGPPHFRITGIVLPGSKLSEKIQEISRKLSEMAKFYRVPVEHTTVVDNWENVTSAQLGLRHDEVLVVDCDLRDCNLLDESIMTTSPRKIVLDRIRSMNPKILVTEMENASCNEPFFMSRIRGTIKFFSARFDYVDVLMPMDCESRQLVEMYIYGREIVNIVACEGPERVERTEPYSQWQRRIQRAGFRQKPLHFSIVSSIKSMLGAYNKHFGIGEDGCWFLMGWKSEILLAYSMWEPVSPQHMVGKLK